jgi:hypothetical protein
MDFPSRRLHQCVRLRERRAGRMMRAGRIRPAKSRGATYCDRLAALPRIGKQMRRTTFEIEADELKEKQRMEPP